MKCYNHDEKDASSICKMCDKALCKECSIELKGGMVCKATCQEKMKTYEDLQELSSKVKVQYENAVDNSNRRLKNYGLMRIVMGVFLLSFAGIYYYTYQQLAIAIAFLIMGVTMVFYGIKELGIKSNYKK